MKIHRFIADIDLSPDTIRLQDEALVHQLGRVLRLQTGMLIQVCDGKGHEVILHITEITKTSVRGEVQERLTSQPESVRLVTLYAAILKRENMEWVIQKATEVGVHQIVPLITHRTIKQDIRLDRLQQIAHEATEQCGRGMIPFVSPPRLFREALVDASSHDQNFFFHTQDVTSYTKPKPLSSLAEKLGVFIGPEGGWDEEEMMMAMQAGLESRTLGTFVLRGETAAIIASYLIIHQLAL